MALVNNATYIPTLALKHHTQQNEKYNVCILQRWILFTQVSMVRVKHYVIWHEKIPCKKITLSQTDTVTDNS